MVICVTNRKLCRGDFLKTMEKACARSDMVILREKDLDPLAYTRLAEEVQRLCNEKGVLFGVHSRYEAARELSCDILHLSYGDFLSFAAREPLFCPTGVSIHSVEEGLEAERLGASYLIAGHVYETASKEGKAPRGLGFINSLAVAVQIPVYAIGGIHEGNGKAVLDAGAKGLCMMSQMMLL